MWEFLRWSSTKPQRLSRPQFGARSERSVRCALADMLARTIARASSGLRDAIFDSESTLEVPGLA